MLGFCLTRDLHLRLGDHPTQCRVSSRLISSSDFRKRTSLFLLSSSHAQDATSTLSFSFSFPFLCSNFLCQLLCTLLELQCLDIAVSGYCCSPSPLDPSLSSSAAIQVSLGALVSVFFLSDWGSRDVANDHVLDRSDQFFVGQRRNAEPVIEQSFRHQFHDCEGLFSSSMFYRVCFQLGLRH